MATWQWRAAWVGRTLILAVVIYVTLGLVLNITLFGAQGGSPNEYALLAAVTAAIALGTSVLVRVRRPDLGVRALNDRVNAWTDLHPAIHVAGFAVLTGAFFALLDRDLLFGLEAVPVGAALAWFARRTNRRRLLP